MFCRVLSVGTLGSCPISRISFLLPGLWRGLELLVLGTALVSTQDLESPYSPPSPLNALSISRFSTGTIGVGQSENWTGWRISRFTSWSSSSSILPFIKYGTDVALWNFGVTWLQIPAVSLVLIWITPHASGNISVVDFLWSHKYCTSLTLSAPFSYVQVTPQSARVASLLDCRGVLWHQHFLYLWLGTWSQSWLGHPNTFSG